jgi:glucose/mannose-6-phosphate isomerase
LNISTLEKYDSEKMYKIYDKWPEIAQKSFKADYEPINFGKIEHIVFAGMGGSGALSDLMFSIFSKTGIHIDIVKGYLLPMTVNSKTLVVTISVSGDTVETLNILKSAHKIKSKTISFSNGGKIEKYCKKNKLEFRKVPIYHSPRASLPSFLYTMLNVFKPILPIQEKEIIKSIKKMSKLRDEISSENFNGKNTALNLAKWMPNIPIVYYPFGLQAAAVRFKNSLQENAKLHVISEDIIEASHNGIVAWDNSKNFKPILIRGQNDFSKTKERWEIIKEFFDERNIEYKEIFTLPGNIVTKIVNLIYFFDYVSIYTAGLRKIDPTPTYPIKFIKDRI